MIEHQVCKGKGKGKGKGRGNQRQTFVVFVLHGEVNVCG